jgi:hypothetical protein
MAPKECQNMQEILCICSSACKVGFMQIVHYALYMHY